MAQSQILFIYLQNLDRKQEYICNKVFKIIVFTAHDF